MTRFVSIVIVATACALAMPAACESVVGRRDQGLRAAAEGRGEEADWRRPGLRHETAGGGTTGDVWVLL